MNVEHLIINQLNATQVHVKKVYDITRKASFFQWDKGDKSNRNLYTTIFKQTDIYKQTKILDQCL